jgi:hypothetical protein
MPKTLLRKGFRGRQAMSAEQDKKSSNEVQGDGRAEAEPNKREIKKWWRDPTVIAAIILTAGTLGSAILSRWP